MTKMWKNLVKVTPLALGASVIAGQAAMAQSAPNSQSPIDPASQQLIQQMQMLRDGKRIDTQVYDKPMSQVTSVNQLRDVEPTAWAYEALRSLVERYGCIVGYPDRTYRGDRALTRWEFAAGLNACLNVLERLIQEGTNVAQEDLEKLKRLIQEFEAELAALGARVDNLESRVSFLEDHQFSTTTKLKGEVVFSIADSFGDYAEYTNPGAPARPEQDSQTVFNDRVRLNLETSFTGKDVLKTRLQAGNFNPVTFNQPGVTGTNQTRLAYDDGANNDVTIDDLFYRTPIGENFTLWVGANALNLDDVFNTLNPYLQNSGTGSLSRLERYNNLVYRGPSGTGLALKYKFSDSFNLTGTYLADSTNASNPGLNNGFLNGSYSAGAQLGFTPTKGLDLAFTYVHSYQTGGTDGRIGSGLFGNVSSPDAETPFGRITPTSSDRYGLQMNWKFADSFNFSAWGGFAQAYAEDGTDRDTDIWTWNAAFSFVDLGKEGAVLSLGGGMPPKGDEEDTSYIIQAQYSYPILDNIQLTPGFFVILNPNQDDANNTQWMGVLRTTFTF